MDKHIEELINNAMLSSLEGYAFLVADSIEFELGRKLTTTEHQQVFVAVERVASGNSSLLAKLEAAEKEIVRLDKRNANLNSTNERWAVERAENAGLKERAEAAEARLLVPIKLPPRRSASYFVDEEFSNADLAAIYNAARLEFSVNIKNAGYPVEGGE